MFGFGVFSTLTVRQTAKVTTRIITSRLKPYRRICGFLRYANGGNDVQNEILRLVSKGNQATPNSAAYCVCAARGSKFAGDRRDMKLDGVLADLKPASNQFVR